jgi:hypothetical protein
MCWRNARWLALAALLAVPACQADERPNVLLITLDTTRADRLGAMGDEAARWPGAARCSSAPTRAHPVRCPPTPPS